jgi:hypothetical protein
MLDIFLSPTRAFSRLKDKPTWLVPLIVVLVFNMLIAFVSARYVDWDKQRQVAVDKMRERNMTEEQIQKATEGMDKFYGSPVMRYGMPAVSALFVSIVGVLFLAVVYNVSLPLLGGTSDFKRMWAVVCNASLIAVPSAVVRGALVLMKKSAEVSTGLSMLAPNLKNPFLSVVLARLDVFAIWELILCAIGLNVVFGLKGAKSYLLVFSVWAVLTVIFAILGARVGG